MYAQIDDKAFIKTGLLILGVFTLSSIMGFVLYVLKYIVAVDIDVVLFGLILFMVGGIVSVIGLFLKSK